MPINPDYLGKTYPPTEPYEVSRVKLREFAEAIGDPNPLYTSREAAQKAGYPDVIAPPTFGVVIAMAAGWQALADPGLNLNYAMAVHGEQRFEYARPLGAGDLVTAEVTISSIRQVGSLGMLTTTTKINTVDGEHVCTAHSTIVERGA
jgi:acyl dehydratase